MAALHDDSVNPHLRYANTDAHGYGTATITSDAISVRLVTMETIVDHARRDRVKSVATFVIPHREAGEVPVIVKA